MVSESPTTETRVADARKNDARSDDALTWAAPNNSSAATEPNAASSPVVSTCRRDDSGGNDEECMRANSASAVRDDPQNPVKFLVGEPKFYFRDRRGYPRYVRFGAIEPVRDTWLTFRLPRLTMIHSVDIPRRRERRADVRAQEVDHGVQANVDIDSGSCRPPFGRHHFCSECA